MDVPDRPFQSASGFRHPCLNVPARKVIQPALQKRGAHSQQREALPLLETFDKSLHPAIQKWTSHPRADVADTQLFHDPSEFSPEVRVVVGNQELRLVPLRGRAPKPPH